MRWWAGLVGAGLMAAQTIPVKLDNPSVIDRGRKDYAATCGVYFCHGAGGQAGRGPRLAGRRLAPQAVYKMVAEGSQNRLMPAMKGTLTEEQIWSVIAYVLTLGPEGGLSAAAIDPVAGPPVPSQPVDPDSGDPEAGRAIFFDASNPQNCAQCHQVGGRGTPVGPDLGAVAKRSPAEILRDIVEPDARLAVAPVTVTLKSGEIVTGMVRQETREFVRLYATGSLPPVLRTIYRDQIAATRPERKSPMPSGYGETLSRKQLLDLVAFLKGAPVSAAELEAPR